jgi:hypothetical protein
MHERRALAGDVHELASRMPHVTVEHGPQGNPIYQVGGKSFVFFRTARPDALDPDTGERYPDVIAFWVPSEADKQALVQDPGSPFFTTPHFDGHLSVLVRASRVSELTLTELTEVVQDAWLSRASARRARAWLAAQPGHQRALSLGGRYGRTVPDAIFADPRLAPLYDAFDGSRGDLPAYIRIAAELGAERVLDVGCGTGSLAIELAATGRAVVAADPAAASLDVARLKDRNGTVAWVHADAAGVPAAGADLAVMTGNVAQVFLTESEWARALQGIGAALRSRGYLVFETRRPGRRAWEEWAGPVTRDVPGIGPVERRGEVTAVNLPFVSFRYTYTFLSDGAIITSDSTLRFRSREELEASLAAQGYQVLDVREAPDRPGHEFVFITQRT